MTMIYSNPDRENEANALPDVEVYKRAALKWYDAQRPGWYWRTWNVANGSIFHAPNGDSHGPFATEQEAIDDAQGFGEVNSLTTATKETEMRRVYVAEIQVAFVVPDGQDPDGWICDTMSEAMRNLTCEPEKSGFLDWRYIEPEHDRFRAIGYANCDTYDDIESELFARVSPRDTLAARYERALCDVLTVTRREPDLGPHGEWGGTKEDIQGDYVLYDDIETIVRRTL